MAELLYLVELWCLTPLSTIIIYTIFPSNSQSYHCSFNMCSEWTILEYEIIGQEMFENTKGVIKNHKSKRDKAMEWPNEKRQILSTRHYTEN
jgi:hypothetical protein